MCSVDTCFIHKRMAIAAICGQSDSSNFRAVFLFYTKNCLQISLRFNSVVVLFHSEIRRGSRSETELFSHL